VSDRRRGGGQPLYVYGCFLRCGGRRPSSSRALSGTRRHRWLRSVHTSRHFSGVFKKKRKPNSVHAMQDCRSNEPAEKRMGLQSPLPQRLPYRPSPEPRSPSYSSVLHRTDEEALLFYTAAPTQRPKSPAQLVRDPLARHPAMSARCSGRGSAVNAHPPVVTSAAPSQTLQPGVS